MARRRHTYKEKRQQNQKPRRYYFQEPTDDPGNFLETEAMVGGKRTKVWARMSRMEDMAAVAEEIFGGMSWRAGDLVGISKE